MNSLRTSGSRKLKSLPRSALLVFEPSDKVSKAGCLIAEILAVERARWTAGNCRTGRNVSRHHATSADHRIIPNDDSR